MSVNRLAESKKVSQSQSEFAFLFLKLKMSPKSVFTFFSHQFAKLSSLANLFQFKPNRLLTLPILIY